MVVRLRCEVSQDFPHGAAVEFVLLNQQVLGAGGLCCGNDGREIEVALAHFGELDNVLELGHEVRRSHRFPGSPRADSGIMPIR